MPYDHDACVQANTTGSLSVVRGNKCRNETCKIGAREDHEPRGPACFDFKHLGLLVED